jgi:phosphoribosylaminoimidazole carboxylase PurE protein
MKKVAIIMGSESDFKIMKSAAEVLTEFGVDYDQLVISAHRTPEKMLHFAKSAHERYHCLIAGAGGAAHLPGMLASATTLPVIGVPINITSLSGLDSLLSIVQMPKGIPVASVAIDNATNAALLAVRILSLLDPELQKKLSLFQAQQQAKVTEQNQRISQDLRIKS